MQSVMLASGLGGTDWDMPARDTHRLGVRSEHLAYFQTCGCRASAQQSRPPVSMRTDALDLDRAN
jgi:hypothetical protein